MGELYLAPVAVINNYIFFFDTLAVFSPPLHSGLSTVTGFCFGVPSWWALFSTLEEHIVSGIALALGFAQLVYTKARARLWRLGYELSCVCGINLEIQGKLEDWSCWGLWTDS